MRQWLIELRTSKKMSQENIAVACGISRQYYSFIENGSRNASVKVAKKIADALGFDWQRFFD